jgi:hypothetical protein
MTTDLIVSLSLAAAAILLFVFWKAGRALALAALSHPLRTNVISVDASGTTHIEPEIYSKNGHEQQGTKELREEEQEQYTTLAKTR